MKCGIDSPNITTVDLCNGNFYEFEMPNRDYRLNYSVIEDMLDNNYPYIEESYSIGFRSYYVDRMFPWALIKNP